MNRASFAEQPALTHEAYVWQRSWNSSVTRAVSERADQLAGLIVLNEEIFFPAGRPDAIRVSPDFGLLTKTRRPVGLALRIGPFSGSFASNDAIATFICSHAASLIAAAQAGGLRVSEIQVDFDCAESKLDGYRRWVQAIRQTVAPVRLIITALPSWLNQPSFKALVSATDGYVLQVHSVERPRDITSAFTLCDPVKASQAIQQAGSFERPFRVALPTYGYHVAYNAAGQFAGLAAEGGSRAWPEGTQLREVRSNPQDIARLVQCLTTNHPLCLRGILWYRLPVGSDTLNWRWPTLQAIMAARSPTESFRAEAHRVEAGLVEINLVNNGELDISSRLAVEVRWSRENGTRLLAADGLHGFQVADGEPSTLQLKIESPDFRLPAGDSQVIGWLRFNQDREVQVEARKL